MNYRNNAYYQDQLITQNGKTKAIIKHEIECFTQESYALGIIAEIHFMEEDNYTVLMTHMLSQFSLYNNILNGGPS